MEERSVDLLIIGAGPYGLAMAARAGQSGLDYLIVGDPMSFWRDHMPVGMFLRSASDWHLDPAGIDTIEAYLDTLGRTPEEIEPLSLAFYLDYAEWFQHQKCIAPIADHVTRLDRTSSGAFRATLTGGHTIRARRVVVALGFGAFKHIPPELAELIPAGSYSHTCDAVEFGPLRGKRVLIVGGRQSAYEWSALLRESGVERVDVVHRHPAPSFVEADWSWVGPLVDRMHDNPGWYRRCSDAEQDAISARLFAEGRLKVEPWLQSRVERDGIRIWPESRVEDCRIDGDELRVTLAGGEHIAADHVILATGYRVQIDRLPLLASGNVLPHLATRNGFPVLDDVFQTSLPGLFITSMPATQDFGPFFAFTIAARASAQVIGGALTAQ